MTNEKIADINGKFEDLLKTERPGKLAALQSFSFNNCFMLSVHYRVMEHAESLKST